uniref:NS1 n=1 Tax=Sitobion miscanthi densovirus TaxID=2218538 RepID=A0A2U9K350_9VIRU|nr:NS [Sitobion miscanthi densovirus]
MESSMDVTEVTEIVVSPVHSEGESDNESIICSSQPAKKMKMSTSLTNSFNHSTKLGELLLLGTKNYGENNVTERSVVLRIISLILNAKLSELTLTIVPPLITMLVHESLWSEMTCPQRWKKRFRQSIFWITNDVRESEYQVLLNHMATVTTKPLAKWRASYLPKYGEEITGTFLTYLSLPEITQLIESLMIFGSTYYKESPDLSTSLPPMGTTSTSRTPARTAQVPVDVHSWAAPLLSNYVDDDEFEKMFDVSHSENGTGTTSLTTYVHRPDKSKKWAAPVLMKDFVIDIHVYEKKMIRRLDPNDYWKAAFCRARGTFDASSPYVKLAKTIQQEVFRQVMKEEYRVTDPTQGPWKKSKKDD